MTRDEWQRIKHLAGEALELEVSARDAFLAAACGPDAALRGEVDALVAAAHAAADLYEVPALALADPSLAAAAAAAARAGAAEPADPDAALSPGTRLGPYRIVREIGRGGMGRVYLAARSDGEFDQQVAIKLVDAGLASATLVARLRQERQILAVLDHPNIARLLDGGTTPDGQPYVVMEYVEGLPIDAFCDRAGLDLPARIELVRALCGAVHHAHQHLVIHRDIKPGNVLVTADGVPKLLDFGIATLVDPDPGADPAEARARTTWRALTFESASPEQVTGEPVTVAADIYGLGQLLYRLLARRGPYQPEPRTEADWIQAIREQAPTPPGQAVRQDAGAPPPVPGIRRDLDRIVLKALRKSPARRYRSAAELADDLARYLDGRPVLAAPDTARYRAATFLRRHWVASAAVAIAIGALVVTAAVAVVQARAAQRARADAERRFGDVRRMANAFLFEFHDAIADLPGSLPARRLVVERGLEYLDGLSREARDDRGLQRELAAAYLRMGAILGGGGVSNLGDIAGARESYRRALDIQTAVAAGGAPEDVDELAHVRIELSRFAAVTGDLPGAVEHARVAVALAESAPASRPGRGARLATALHQLGYVQASASPPDEARSTLARAFDLARRELDAAPADAVALARVARIAPDYATALLRARGAGEALRVATDARAWTGELLRVDPANPRYRQTLTMILTTQAEALETLGRRPEAIDALTRAAATIGALGDEAPSDQGNRIGVMLTNLALGRMLLRDGQDEAGVGRLRDGIAAGETILRAAPDQFFVAGQVASARISMGQSLWRRSETRAAGCREVRAGLDAWDRVAGTAPDLARTMRPSAPARLGELCGS
ncbi:MAG: serine/threonine-protein kinase [Vicinamibacterales bacterium]